MSFVISVRQCGDLSLLVYSHITENRGGKKLKYNKKNRKKIWVDEMVVRTSVCNQHQDRPGKKEVCRTALVLRTIPRIVDLTRVVPVIRFCCFLVVTMYTALRCCSGIPFEELENTLQKEMGVCETKIIQPTRSRPPRQAGEDPVLRRPHYTIKRWCNESLRLTDLLTRITRLGQKRAASRRAHHGETPNSYVS